MQSFTDNAGRTWNVQFNVTTIRRVRDAIGFDFGTCMQDDGESYFAMFNNPEMLADVLYVICKGQCEHQNVSRASFVDAFDGEVYDAAGPALQRAFAFFCPNPYRQALLTMLQPEPTTGQETTTETVSSSEQGSESTPDLTAFESSSECTKHDNSTNGTAQRASSIVSSP